MKHALFVIATIGFLSGCLENKEPNPIVAPVKSGPTEDATIVTLSSSEYNELLALINSLDSRLQELEASKVQLESDLTLAENALSDAQFDIQAIGSNVSTQNASINSLSETVAGLPLTTFTTVVSGDTGYFLYVDGQKKYPLIGVEENGYWYDATNGTPALSTSYNPKFALPTIDLGFESVDCTGTPYAVWHDFGMKLVETKNWLWSSGDGGFAMKFAESVQLKTLNSYRNPNGWSCNPAFEGISPRNYYPVETTYYPLSDYSFEGRAVTIGK